MLRHSLSSIRSFGFRIRIPNVQHQIRCLGSRRGKWDNNDDLPEEPDELVNVNEIPNIVSPDFTELYKFREHAFLDDEDENLSEEEEESDRREMIRDDLDSRSGRLFTDPWEITDEDWSSKLEYDDLPDWTPESATKLSRERVKVLEGGVPTLAVLSKLPLPPPVHPHPSVDAKTFAASRKEMQFKYILSQVEALAKDKVASIEKLPTWEEKQDAVDELFETVEFTLKEKEAILGRHPSFPMWVEKATEQFLESTQRSPSLDQANLEKTESELDDEALPLFMELFDPNDAKDGVVPTVPKILHPLQPHPKHGDGRMVEEWELAAHDKTRRIMLRQSTREVARILELNNSSRVYINGDKGVGKTAVLLSIVAAGRKSGHIVLFAPDGNRLRMHGHYIEPNPCLPGLFDLPILSQELCSNLFESHAGDLESMQASAETKMKYTSPEMMRRMPEGLRNELSLLGLLEYGKKEVVFAPMCYSIVVETLMDQDEKPFLVVLDDFNCYYDYGHYFHMEYDQEVKKPIPLNKITLFKPFLDTMGIEANPEMTSVNPSSIKRGGIVVAVSENKAVARRFTDGLTESALLASKNTDSDSPMHVVTVPRYSNLEVDHILSNFDIIGIGRLRFDRGETVVNQQEAYYLRMLSGSNGQLLLDACIV